MIVQRKTSEEKSSELFRSILTLVIAAAMAGVFMLCGVSRAFAVYTESVIAITKDGQVADSFCGVEAEYITTYSDTGIYSCAGYVKKFYATLFGANVYQINTYDGPPLVSMEGHTVSLKEVSTPKPGDIMQNKNRTHVAVVKSVSGSNAILIEQNYKWTSNGVIYARINRSIDIQSAYFYRLVVDGKEAVIDSEENYVPDTYEIWRVDDASGINVRSGAGTGYEKIGTLGNGTIFYVYGKIIADDYTWGKIHYNGKPAYVALEFSEYMSGTITKDTTPPVISDVKVTDINSSGYTVTCKVTDNVQVSRVQFPTWTVQNGQDDLCSDWEKSTSVSGKIEGDKVTFRVNISRHNGEKGKYATHIYAYDSSGNSSSCMISPLYAGYEDLGRSFYAAIKSCKGTYVTNEGTNVTARKMQSAATELRKQMWKFTRQADGSYKITSAVDGKALYVKGASGADGTNIIPYNSQSSKGQNWYIYKLNGKYQFGASCTNCYMTLNGGSSADGTNIKMKNISGKSEQSFYIENLPQQPVITSVVSTDYNKLTIRYSTLNFVSGYKIYRLNDSTRTYQLIATIKSPSISSYTDNNCIAGQKYYYKVRAYSNISSTNQLLSSYSINVSGTALPKTTSITSLTAASTTATLKWTSVSGASGYEIYRSTEKNGKYYNIKTVTPGTRHSYTDSALKPGKNYYYKIRVFRKVNGVNVYSGYSAPVHVKTKS